MLFDLRGRGRRRTVRVIYIGLAVVFLLGFVGLGVGGGLGSTGIFDVFTNKEGSSSASFSGQIKKYEKLTRQQPSNLSAWEGLVKAQLNQGGSEEYVSSSGVVTSKGHEFFAQIAQSWSSYLALNPPKPNPELAKKMLVVFGIEGLDRPSDEVALLQIIVAAEPKNAAYWGTLAEYAYLAKNSRVADLAAQKALALAQPSQRPLLKARLAEFKKAAQSAASSTGTKTSSGSGIEVKGTTKKK